MLSEPFHPFPRAIGCVVKDHGIMLIHQALAVILPFPYVGVWTVVSGLCHRVILYSCIHSPPPDVDFFIPLISINQGPVVSYMFTYDRSDGPDNISEH